MRVERALVGLCFLVMTALGGVVLAADPQPEDGVGAVLECTAPPAMEAAPTPAPVLEPDATVTEAADSPDAAVYCPRGYQVPCWQFHDCKTKIGNKIVCYVYL